MPSDAILVAHGGILNPGPGWSPRLDFPAAPGYEPSMATPRIDDVQFPLAFCTPCGREVVPYLEDAAGEQERRCCVHCDAPIDGWRDGDTADLEAAGYALLEARGCGNGGGCSSGCGMRR